MNYKSLYQYLATHILLFSCLTWVVICVFIWIYFLDRKEIIISYTPKSMINSHSLSWEQKIFDLYSDSSYEKFVSPVIAYQDIHYKPSDLEKITETEYLAPSWNGYLRSEVHLALSEMSEEFYKKFHEKIKIVSSYRSYEYQSGIEEKSPECVHDGFCARPGHSEHQSWLAFDIFETTNYDDFLANNQYKDYYDWLLVHAHKYGFTNSYRKWKDIDGYNPEPWHWRYVGRELASELFKKNLTFSEYFKMYQK